MRLDANPPTAADARGHESGKPPLPLSSFLDYVRAFNARDCELFTSFYAPDIELILPDASLSPLHGVAAIAAHYRAVHARAEQTIVPQVVLVDGAGAGVFFIMDVLARFLAGEDQNEVLATKIWAHYEITAQGRIRRITCMTVSSERLGVVDVKERIEESRRRADPRVLL